MISSLSLSILPLAYLRGRTSKRLGTRAGAVYAALRSVDTLENERRCKACALDLDVAAGGLRLVARVIVFASCFTLPWLPGLIAIYVFKPYATMTWNGGSFPRQLRRQRTLSRTPIAN